MKIGITGGIGSGKTFICDLLRQRGYDIYSCDDEAKRLMRENGSIISGIKALIGEDAYTSDGEINKPVIARYLFANAANGAKVNAIVHPVVRQDYLKWAENRDTAIMECAILFESGFDTIVDRTVVVWAKDQTRLKRAMVRDHATKEQIQERMAAQIPGSEAVRRADYVFRHESYDETDSELERLIQYINSEKIH